MIWNLRQAGHSWTFITESYNKLFQEQRTLNAITSRYTFMKLSNDHNVASTTEGRFQVNILDTETPPHIAEHFFTISCYRPSTTIHYEGVSRPLTVISSERVFHSEQAWRNAAGKKSKRWRSRILQMSADKNKRPDYQTLRGVAAKNGYAASPEAGETLKSATGQNRARGAGIPDSWRGEELKKIN